LVPDLQEAFDVIESPMLRDRAATVIADALVCIGLGGKTPYHGFVKDVVRPEACQTRELLRDLSSRAASVGVLPDHQLLMLTLLARFGLDAGDSLTILEHLWRIEPELMLPTNEQNAVIAIPHGQWTRLFESALERADDYSMQLAEQLITEHAGAPLNQARVRALLLRLFRHRLQHVRAASLRMLESITLHPRNGHDALDDESEL